MIQKEKCKYLFSFFNYPLKSKLDVTIISQMAEVFADD